MKKSAKVTYAQSSDIKARSFFQYRMDMKKKAIAELEFLPYLQSILRQQFKDSQLGVSKSGGDAKVWFARDGKVTREPDYECIMASGEKLFYEFQYAEATENLQYFDFKLSKVGRKPKNQSRIPHQDRDFFYVVKPENKYAFVSCEWIMRHGKEGNVPAWGSRRAYRVPKALFLEQCRDGGAELERVITVVDNKNLLLEFQHAFIEAESTKLHHLLQQVVDENKLMKVLPRTLEGFFQVCFLLDKLQKSPDSPGVWLVYLGSFLDSDMNSLDFARFMYALDYVYFKCENLAENEQKSLSTMLSRAKTYIDKHFKTDVQFINDYNAPAIEVIRRLLFATNIWEDIVQDCVATWGMRLDAIKKIFQTIPNVDLMASHIKIARDQQ